MGEQQQDRTQFFQQPIPAVAAGALLSKAVETVLVEAVGRVPLTKVTVVQERLLRGILEATDLQPLHRVAQPVVVVVARVSLALIPRTLTTVATVATVLPHPLQVLVLLVLAVAVVRMETTPQVPLVRAVQVAVVLVETAQLLSGVTRL